MKPLQIWLPVFNTSFANPAAERDANRAFECWRGESTLWLLPEIKTAVRWRQGPHYVVAIPSETFDRIDICHVGKNEHVIGPATECFQNSSTSGILNDWLSTQQVRLYAAADALQLEVPRIVGGKIRFEKVEYSLQPGPIIPIDEFDEITGKFSSKWPPRSCSYKTMSPEAESMLKHGRLTSSHREHTVLANSEQTGVNAVCVTVGWPGKPGLLIPPSGGLDVIFGRTQMGAIYKSSRNDPAAALSRARVLARKYVFEGNTSREFEWFWPTIDHAGSKAVLFQAEDFGLRVNRWSELRDHPDFKALLGESVPIRRAWGSLGVLWALLLERLEEYGSFRFCQKCGTIIKGSKNKQYCGAQDNRQCFSDRRAADQRRSRAGDS